MRRSASSCRLSSTLDFGRPRLARGRTTLWSSCGAARACSASTRDLQGQRRCGRVFHADATRRILRGRTRKGLVGGTDGTGRARRQDSPRFHRSRLDADCGRKSTARCAGAEAAEKSSAEVRCFAATVSGGVYCARFNGPRDGFQEGEDREHGRCRFRRSCAESAVRLRAVRRRAAGGSAERARRG